MGLLGGDAPPIGSSDPEAEFGEAEWQGSTESMPFDPLASGRIAVKVINHYGDEVLKVFPVETKKRK